MFSALTSPWTMPRLCMQSSASATCAMMSSARRTGIGPALGSINGSPSTSSITMYAPSSGSSPKSTIDTMFAWMISLASLASWLNRARATPSLANVGEMTFSANGLPRLRWRTRYTSPIAPAPRWPSSTYRPPTVCIRPF
jgi:hypothetical protein